MDAVEHMRSAARRLEAARDLLTTAYKELDAASEMAEHCIRHWSQELRTPVESVRPSQLPDRTLGPALCKVRDFLAPAPGAASDPAFDEAVSAVGLDDARRRADLLLGAGRPTDEIWRALRGMAPPGCGGMERAE